MAGGAPFARISFIYFGDNDFGRTAGEAGAGGFLSKKSTRNPGQRLEIRWDRRDDARPVQHLDATRP